MEELTNGFVFAPFAKAKDRVFLKGDYIFSFEDHQQHPVIDQKKETHHWLHHQPGSLRSKSVGHINPNQKPNTPVDFKTLVDKSIAAIQAGSFEKVVASRMKRIDLSDAFDPIAAFRQLSAAYPNAFISLVSIYELGTWLGASPEILVTTEGDLFRTVALAGSQPMNPGTDVKDVAWKQKEIEEQALVSRYIINCFKKIRLREFEEHGPKTVVAGNIFHLNTEFIVDMNATNFPQLGSVMLKLLHPTSAVCGMPLESAFQFLVENEGYNREFYAGYLGPVNFKSRSNLYVNLRCLQLLEKEAIVYAGAGITHDSDAEKEWEETELKMRTLLQVLSK